MKAFHCESRYDGLFSVHTCLNGMFSIADKDYVWINIEEGI